MSNPRWKRSIDGASAQSSGKGSAAMNVWSSRLDHYDAVRRARRMTFTLFQPVWCSIQ
jgi:hypothetical protein